MVNQPVDVILDDIFARIAAYSDFGEKSMTYTKYGFSLQHFTKEQLEDDIDITNIDNIELPGSLTAVVNELIEYGYKVSCPRAASMDENDVVTLSDTDMVLLIEW
jgi:hypothetical protein